MVFLGNFVIKSHKYIPQLVNIYQGKMRFLELGIGSKEKHLCFINHSKKQRRIKENRGNLSEKKNTFAF